MNNLTNNKKLNTDEDYDIFLNNIKHNIYCK